MRDIALDPCYVEPLFFRQCADMAKTCNPKSSEKFYYFIFYKINIIYTIYIDIYSTYKFGQFALKKKIRWFWVFAKVGRLLYFVDSVWIFNKLAKIHLFHFLLFFFTLFFFCMVLLLFLFLLPFFFLFSPPSPPRRQHCRTPLSYFICTSVNVSLDMAKIAMRQNT